MQRISVLVVVGLLLTAGCGREGTDAGPVVESARPVALPSPTPTATPTATPTPTLTPTATPQPTASATTPRPAPTTVSWTRVHEGDFSFEVPSDMRKERVQGGDTQVGRYRSSDAFLQYHYGSDSSDCANEDAPEYKDTWTRIDGRLAHESYWRREPGTRDENKPATFYEYQGCVYFPNVNDTSGSTPRPGTGRSKLSMLAYSEDGWDDPNRTIGSVRFN